MSSDKKPESKKIMVNDSVEAALRAKPAPTPSQPTSRPSNTPTDNKKGGN